MTRRASLSLRIWLLTLVWALVLAVSPWWIGFPLLLAMAAVLLFLAHRLAGEHRWVLRHGLRWGLPGVLFALQRAIGGNVFAWIIAMLGMLTGYTLLAGLEAWLDRDKRRARAASAGAVARPSISAKDGEWSTLALAPMGPSAEIIELQPPVWQSGASDIQDPHGGRVHYSEGAYRFDDGTHVDGGGSQATFSPAGRWFATRIDDDRGVVLRDRERGKMHRLRGWRLDGWYREQPWLVRRDGDMPLALRAVLGDDPVDD